jgi:hypothetical protein
LFPAGKGRKIQPITITMTGKQKLYFLLGAIEDAIDIAPSGYPLLIDPTNTLNRKYSDVELSQLFTKLEKDEKVLRVLKVPVRIKLYHDEFDRYEQADDGCWHIELLPPFGGYFDKIQHEPEYFAFTGRKPALTQNDESEIDGWLAGKDERTKRRIWQVVSAIYYEWQLRDQDIFPIPYEKFSRQKITNDNDITAILTNLHNRKIVEVARKLGETPASSDPSKPQGSVWTTISDDPQVFHHPDALIKIFPKKFGYMANKLKNLVTETPEKDDNRPEVQPTNTGIEWQDAFEWHGNDFVFGKYGKVTFVSPDRKKLFKLLAETRGNWVTVQKMMKETEKDEAAFIRPTIGQIEKQFKPELRRHVSIPSTQDDDAGVKPNQGAYRIKFTTEPQRPQPSSKK